MKAGVRAKEVADHLGVIRRTVYKRVPRYKDGGREGLPNRCSRPHRGPIAHR